MNTLSRFNCFELYRDGRNYIPIIRLTELVTDFHVSIIVSYALYRFQATLYEMEIGALHLTVFSKFSLLQQDFNVVISLTF